MRQTDGDIVSFSGTLTVSSDWLLVASRKALPVRGDDSRGRYTRRSDVVDPIMSAFNKAADEGQTSCWQRFPCRSLHESVERISLINSLCTSTTILPSTTL